MPISVPVRDLVSHYRPQFETWSLYHAVCGRSREPKSQGPGLPLIHLLHYVAINMGLQAPGGHV